MKKHLTKIYNIFKQIEALNGVSGWDQDKSFYYFYESNDLVRCWELLYGLFSENKQLDIKKFGVDLNITQLRKLAFGRSCVYEFDSIGVTPVLVATFERNGKHQISGKVEIEETSISEEKTVEFIDGNKIDEDFEENDTNSKLKIFLLSNVGNMSVDKDELLKLTNESTIQSLIDTGVLEESIGNSYVIVDMESFDLVDESPAANEHDLQFMLKTNLSFANKFESLLKTFNVDLNWVKLHLIKIDALTINEFRDLDYIQDRIEAHKSHDEDVIIIEDTITGLFNIFETYFESTHWKHDEKSVAEGFESYKLAAEFCKENNYNIQSNKIYEEIEDDEPTDESEAIYVLESGISLAFSFFDYIEDFSVLTEQEFLSIINKLKSIEGLTIFTDNDGTLSWETTYGIETEVAEKLNELLHSSQNQEIFDNSNITLQQKSKIETFQINGVTPDTLGNLEEVSLFLDYLYDDCGLLGNFHPDNDFADYLDYLDNEGTTLFTEAQQLLYGKYIDDMFEMDSDGTSLFKFEGYDDIYDYCMNYRNDSYNTAQKFNFVSYIEDDKLCVGIKSDEEFEGSEDLGDKSYTRYIYFAAREEGYFPQFDNLTITWGDDTNSWNVETNSGFSMMDIGFGTGWESTTPAQVLQYLTEEILGDYQFDKKSDEYMGFININPNDISNMPNYDVILWIINNQTTAEKIANTLGLTIETASSDEFIVSEIEIDLNRKCQQYLTEVRNPKAKVFFLDKSKITDTLDNFDINSLGKDDIFSILRCEVSGPKVIFYEFMVINNDGISENYQSETEYVIDENDNFELVRGDFDDRAELTPRFEGMGGNDLFNMRPKILSLAFDTKISTAKPIVKKPTIVNLEMDLVSQIKWLKSFSKDWDELTNDDFDSEHLDVPEKWVEGKMKVMSEKLDNFCDVNGLVSMSADDLLIELENKNNWFGPLELNNINYRVKLSINEDDENKYYLEFYKNQGFTKVSQLIGDCEIWMDNDGNIDSIEWTLPEYESKIDPEGTLYENEELFEMIQNINLRPY